MNQENQTNNQFIYDLYDDIGRGKRVLNSILESFEERCTEEGISIKNNDDAINNETLISDILFNITLEEIATSILWIAYNTDTGDSRGRASRLMENIKDELQYSFTRVLPYETEETPKMSIEYNQYNESLLYELYIPYINGEDITKSEHYNNVLHFLVKKIFIRGF